MATGSEQECFHEDGFDDKWLGEVLVYTGLAWKIFHLFTNIFELTGRFRAKAGMDLGHLLKIQQTKQTILKYFYRFNFLTVYLPDLDHIPISSGIPNLQIIIFPTFPEKRQSDIVKSCIFHKPKTPQE